MSYRINLSIPLGITLFLITCKSDRPDEVAQRPNILFAIADDQSYPYASIYDATGIKTPAFDKVAESGILFNNAFVAAPQCSPSRAAILTGKNIWQLEEAGTHSSYFPKKFQVFTNLLENAGYDIGFTGKPWAPGNWKDAGWDRNPVGPEYNEKKFDKVPASGISKVDYFANFVDFYEQKSTDKPFFFWYGGHEPHRDYEAGSGQRAGKEIADALVPDFLPDDSLVRSDIEDYALEIEWFDQQLAKMLAFLEEKGELDNTLVVVTADNGMSFPSSKANLMEYGTHVPLAISWPAKIKSGQMTDQLVSMIDLAPTFLEIGQAKPLPDAAGKSMMDILLGNKTNPDHVHRTYVLTGRERHTHARPDNLGYPARAIRRDHFLYIENLKSDRWPAGDPPPTNLDQEIPGERFKSIGLGYCDIDDSPTKEYMIENKDKWPELFSEGYEKRPEEQLFDIKRDPGCRTNLAGLPQYDSVRSIMKNQLENLLTQQGDPRMLGNGDIFESYPRFGVMRDFPGFKEKGAYDPKYQVKKQK